MRTLTGIERTLERLTSSPWSATRTPRPKTRDVPAKLRRECGRNSARLRTPSPRHFTIELPYDAVPVMQGPRRGAGERHRSSGPAAAGPRTGRGEGVQRRYRVRSDVTPHQVPSAQADLTKAPPEGEAPPAPRVKGSAAGMRPAARPEVGALAGIRAPVVRSSRLPVPGRGLWRTGRVRR